MFAAAMVAYVALPMRARLGARSVAESAANLRHVQLRLGRNLRLGARAALPVPPSVLEYVLGVLIKHKTSDPECVLFPFSSMLVKYILVNAPTDDFN